MATVVSTLIELDERGVAWITGTKVKVIEVATDKLAHGSSPEEMHLQYPHLSLAQMYAALGACPGNKLSGLSGHRCCTGEVRR